ncbi:Oxysterol-binding protein 3, partial [Coemansia spiralis]
MEEVEILPRDAYLHTVNITQAPCAIQWWFSTKRKNIDFGLFRREPLPSGGDDVPPSISRAGSSMLAGSRDSTTGTASGRQAASQLVGMQLPDGDGPRAVADAAAKQRGGYFKLQDRNVAVLMPLKHYESAKTTIKGSWEVSQAGTYVLYFDNSFSKNTSKRLSFCVAVKEAAQQNRAGAAGDRRQQPAMSGWLLKKKRKRMQGWASRWISVQGRWLLYSTTEGGIPRAKVDIVNAVVSTSRADVAITVDGDEGFLQLRAQSRADFDAWVAVLKKVKESFAESLPTADAVAAALAGGDGATLSTGAQPSDYDALTGRARLDADAARIHQAHATFESAVERLDQLLHGLGDPDGTQSCLQQIRDSESTLHGILAAASGAGYSALAVTRKNTTASERPSLPATDSWSSRMSVSGSEVFYDTNEVLELVRDEADASPPIGLLQRSGELWTESSTASASASSAAVAARMATTATPAGESDSDSDSGEAAFYGDEDTERREPRLHRMQMDLIRDPDFIEAMAKNNLRSPRVAGEGAAARTQEEEAAEDEDVGDADQRPGITIEKVRAQMGKYEPRTTLPAEAGEVN